MASPRWRWFGSWREPSSAPSRDDATELPPDPIRTAGPARSPRSVKPAGRQRPRTAPATGRRPCAVLTPPSALGPGHELARSFHVPGDLLGQGGRGVEPDLVAQPSPELDGQGLAQQVPFQ